MLAVSFSIWGDRPELARDALVAAAVQLALPADADTPISPVSKQRPRNGSALYKSLLGKGEAEPGEAVYQKKPLISRALDFWQRACDFVSIDLDSPVSNHVDEALGLVLEKPAHRLAISLERFGASHPMLVADFQVNVPSVFLDFEAFHIFFVESPAELKNPIVAAGLKDFVLSTATNQRPYFYILVGGVDSIDFEPIKELCAAAGVRSDRAVASCLGLPSGDMTESFEGLYNGMRMHVLVNSLFEGGFID